ncbi:MAG TPA: glycosyltransferase family A protein [Aliidongia sp.]|nr:glycosyltransferase family A protein [Aliidongia sp.]
MTLVTVIVPVYNRTSELRRALRSILQQSYQEFEILVVNDASTEDIAAVVAEFDDSRIRLISKPVNEGAAAARNTGIAMAQGHWVAFLDSDDEWLPNKLEAQIAQLATRPDGARISCTGYVILHLQERRAREFRPRAKDGLSRALVWGCNLSPGTTLVAERSCFDEIGLFDVTLRRFEDWDWLMRYAEHYPIAIAPEILAQVNKDSMPSHASVVTSLALLRDKHIDGWFARSWLLGRKFVSTLLIEEAAAAFYAQHYRQTLLLLGRSVAAYPLRNAAFYPMAARRLASLFHMPASPFSAGHGGSGFGKVSEHLKN